MIKKVVLVVFFILVIFICVMALQNDPGSIIAKLPAEPFKEGATTLYYRVYLFGVLPVGDAVIEDSGIKKIDKKNLYCLKARAKSSSLISKIYPFEVSLESFLDQATMLPVSFLQKIKTKQKELAKEVSYDQKNNIMQILEVKRSILPETYEPLSAIWKLRTIDFSLQKEVELNINTNQKNYTLAVAATQAHLRLKGLTTPIVRLKSKIFRRDKNPYHQSKVDIIFMDNPNKTPIYIKVFASGMLITVRLTDIR